MGGIRGGREGEKKETRKPVYPASLFICSSILWPPNIFSSLFPVLLTVIESVFQPKNLD